ncbi:MAG TPA: hypothetical protein VFT53_03880 [Candidatus Saccharimonadales bacterium]|nr:hypothetical protein [Candidatus Saccharimonadales bacterium]
MTDLDESLKKLQSLKKRPDGVTSNEWRTIQKGVAELIRRKDFDPKQHKAQTQSDLAKMFICYYFDFLACFLLFVLLYNLISVRYFQAKDTISLRDGFMMISSAITPILAFVLGHYFKGKD